MTDTDLMFVQGIWPGREIYQEITDPEKIKYILNELEAEDLQTGVSLQIRDSVKPLTITLFNLGSQVKEFKVLGQFINDGQKWSKSHRHVQGMIAGLAA